MTTDCGRARRILWPDAGPRPLTSDVEAAQAHVAECGACRAFIGEMRDFAAQVQRHVPRPTAPAAVRERLFTTIARARAMLPAPAPRRPNLLRGTIAGLAVGALIGGGWALGRRASGPIEEPSLVAVARDHVRGLQHDAIANGDAAAVTSWLDERVPFAVRVPDFPGAVLEGARLCLVQGQRGAVVRFRLDGRPVSYYVMPARGPARRDEAAFEEEVEAGYTVVAWRHGGLRHALVGDLPRHRLAALARDCHEQLMAAATPEARP